MKNNEISEQNFRELTISECYQSSGGGFAYDVGRLLRFVTISHGVTGVPGAVLDAVANSIMNQ